MVGLRARGNPCWFQARDCGGAGGLGIAESARSLGERDLSEQVCGDDTGLLERVVSQALKRIADASPTTREA